MRQGDLTGRGDRCLLNLPAPQDGARTVATVGQLLGEVAVDEHPEQPMGGRHRDPDARGDVGDPHRALLLEQRREQQG